MNQTLYKHGYGQGLDADNKSETDNAFHISRFENNDIDVMMDINSKYYEPMKVNDQFLRDD